MELLIEGKQNLGIFNDFCLNLEIYSIKNGKMLYDIKIY